MDCRALLRRLLNMTIKLNPDNISVDLILLITTL